VSRWRWDWLLMWLSALMLMTSLPPGCSFVATPAVWPQGDPGSFLPMVLLLAPFVASCGAVYQILAYGEGITETRRTVWGVLLLLAVVSCVPAYMAAFAFWIFSGLAG